MYKKANIIQKLLLCGFILLGIFCINFSVSQVLNINCSEDGSCKIFNSTLLEKEIPPIKNIDIANLQSMTCKLYQVDKYTLHYKTIRGSGYIKGFNKYDCEEISQKLLHTSSLNDKTLTYKIHKANILQIWAARVASAFFILLAVLIMFCKLEIHTAKTLHNKSRLP